MLLDQFGEEMRAGDLDLLLRRVAGDADLDEEIAQHARDTIEVMRGGDEDRVGEVERDLQITVQISFPVVRMEELLQRLDRIALNVPEADLIDLLQQVDRIGHSRIAVRRNQAPGLSAATSPRGPGELRLASSGEVE